MAKYKGHRQRGIVSAPSWDSDKPHLETRVPHDGLPARASYGEVVAHAEVLSMAIWGLKEMLGGSWPNTLTQEEKNRITAATGEEF